MENNSDICGIVSSIVLDCFLVHYKNKNFGAYTQILDTIDRFHVIVCFSQQSRTTLTPIIHYTAILCTKNVGGIDTTSHILEQLFHKFIIV